MLSDTLIQFLLIFAAAAFVILVVWSLVAAIRSRRRGGPVERRLNGHESDATLTLPDAVPGKAARKTWFQRTRASFGDMVERTGWQLDPLLALAVIVLCGVLPAAAVFVWRMGEHEEWLALPTFLLGVAVPLVILWWRQRVWRRTLQNQLPDVFFLLARSLRAGRSLDQAMQLVGDQGVPPLSKEFARMHRQLELGLPLNTVLANAARRIKLVDFNVFSSVLGLHRTTGGNLPVLLDRLAVATRDRNQFEGQYRAATVMGRYSAAFIAGLAAVIMFYLFFFQRDWAARFFESGTGIALFVAAMALEASGLLLLFWFLRAEY
jgi:tight adherence protein B